MCGHQEREQQDRDVLARLHEDVRLAPQQPSGPEAKAAQLGAAPLGLERGSCATWGLPSAAFWRPGPRPSRGRAPQPPEAERPPRTPPPPACPGPLPLEQPPPQPPAAARTAPAPGGGAAAGPEARGGPPAAGPAEAGEGHRAAEEEAEAEAELEREALRQTLLPFVVMVGAEQAIMDAALAAARAEAKHDEVVVLLKERGKKASIIPKNKGHKEALLSFVPRAIERCISHGLVYQDQWRVLLEPPSKCSYDPVLSRFSAAVVFADASGFTRLTETLANLPKGAEQIGRTLNDFFGPLIDIVHKHGGDVIKFSGDALTIIWAAEDPAPKKVAIIAEKPRRLGCKRASTLPELDESLRSFFTVRQQAVAAAARCCLEIQEKIPSFGTTPVPGCSLTMHIGVGFADVALLAVGGILGRWEFCLAGNALDQIAIAEPLAHSGETVFSPEAAELAAEFFEFEAISGDADGVPEGFAKLLRPKALLETPPFEPPAWWTTNREEMHDVPAKLIKRFVPTSVGICLAGAIDASKVAYPEEMRRVSVIFLSIAGLDPYESGAKGRKPGARAGGRTAQVLMQLFQRTVYALEGSVNKFLVDDKGVLLLIAFGLPPLIHLSDDPVRAVLCGTRLCDILLDEGLEGRVGVATGNCWCGVVGGATRREYTVLGDVVNLSARLMGKAAPNSVLVDAATQEMAAGVLEFQEEGELSLKGKAKPVRACRFLGLRRGGVMKQLGQVQSPLSTWPGWPQRAVLASTLEHFSHRSGVLFITGPGGCGKSELAAQVRAWAKARGWNLMHGQNMDPTGIFTVPRLPLQEAFRDLVNLASADPHWRGLANELIKESLGGPAGRRSRAESSGRPQDRPRQAELYWMLVAMMQNSRGALARHKLQSWAPLLSMVVTDLAFAPAAVNALAERDEQHTRHDRFAEVCASVLDGFSRHQPATVGTMVLLHLHRSSAFYQSHDGMESAAIRAIAELCMQRRAAHPGGEEQSPLVLCLVSREGIPKLAADAESCGAVVLAEDLGSKLTSSFTQHLLGPGADEATREIVSQYAFEVTGGNPLGVTIVVRDLEKRGIVDRGPGSVELNDEYSHVLHLRRRVPLPPVLVGMAFSAFETLSPREQMVLKVASTLQEYFTLHDLQLALPQLPPEELRRICEELSAPRARTLRAVRGRFGSSRMSLPPASLPHCRSMNMTSSTSWHGGVRAPPAGSFRFYSLVLHHVASTLVLETQRSHIRRLTKRSELNAQDFARLATASASSLSEASIGEEEDDRGADTESVASSGCRLSEERRGRN